VNSIGRVFYCPIHLTQQYPCGIINTYQSNKGKLMVDQTRWGIDQVQSDNKGMNFDRQNTSKLNQAKDIYKESKGLDNISELDMKKFRDIMFR